MISPTATRWARLPGVGAPIADRTRFGRPSSSLIKGLARRRRPSRVGDADQAAGAMAPIIAMAGR